jgi:hypothetical protein
VSNQAAVNRKIAVGGVLSEVFSFYREHAGVLLPVAFWLFLAVAILEELAYPEVGPVVVASLIGLIVTVVYQGMAAGLVRDVQGGRTDSSAGDLFRSVRPVLLPLCVAGLLAVLGTLLGTIFLIVPGLIALTYWAVIAPVVVVERTGAIEAFGRSQELVSGNAGRVFATVVLGFVIVVVVTFVLLAAAESLADGPLLRIVFNTLAVTVAAPVSALVAAVLYFRLREIEGARLAEARPADAGDLASPTPDP